eukprot:TRINITY_DN4017_c0_g2_i2.p1 TRINITY_DN4017_c0_g2~~TRINITY_DN4017_c0_g2_i2.p1  ORF type:complete len:309 (+),score=74.05 TRINITY_DN4017_c0_g2_i2:69-929(+)
MAAPRGAVRCAAVCALLAPCGAPPTPRDRSAPPSAPPPPLWSPYEGPGGGGPGGIRTPPLSPGDCVVVVRMARSPLGGFLYPGTEGVVIGVPGATSGSAALVRFSDSAVRDVRPGDVWPLQCSTPPTPPPRAGQSTRWLNQWNCTAWCVVIPAVILILALSITVVVLARQFIDCRDDSVVPSVPVTVVEGRPLACDDAPVPARAPPHALDRLPAPPPPLVAPPPVWDAPPPQRQPPQTEPPPQEWHRPAPLHALHPRHYKHPPPAPPRTPPRPRSPSPAAAPDSLG